MSFGWAAGDVLAVINLFERVIVELRNYRHAPTHFQQLHVELNMHLATIQTVLTVEPDMPGQFVIVQRMRAIATSCQDPLNRLIEKMHSKDKVLGNFRSTAALHGVGTRLHWSMVARGDVEGLRNELLSKMLAINILLGTLQLAQSRSLQPDIVRLFDEQSEAMRTHGREMTLLRSTAENTYAIFSDLQASIGSGNKTNASQLQNIGQKMEYMHSGLTSLGQTLNASTDLVRMIGKKMQYTMENIFLTVLRLKRLIKRLSSLTSEVLQAVSSNAHMLLDIRKHMKQIAETVESIPLHLSLQLIRFDDALGESWALPFQACIAWNSFQQILRDIVFSNNRLDLARFPRYTLTVAKTQHNISYYQWDERVHAGMHIQQSMIIDMPTEVTAEGRRCPFPDCQGLSSSEILESETQTTCTLCSRSFSVGTRYEPMLHLNDWKDLQGAVGNRPSVEATNRIKESLPSVKSHIGPLPPSSKDQMADNVPHFRRVKMLRSMERIVSREEAETSLQADRSDPRGNQYMGWMYLISGELEHAVKHLELCAAHQDQSLDSGQSLYLLGRAYMAKGLHIKAFKAYQSCTYADGYNPVYWVSVANLYLAVNQPKDCLDALARAIRLNFDLVHPWLNLGILYECCDQKVDATDCYKRCLELDPEVIYTQYARDKLDGVIPWSEKKHELVEFPLLGLD